MTLETYDYAGLNDLFRSGMITEDAYYTELMRRKAEGTPKPRLAIDALSVWENAKTGRTAARLNLRSAANAAMQNLMRVQHQNETLMKIARDAVHDINQTLTEILEH